MKLFKSRNDKFKSVSSIKSYLIEVMPREIIPSKRSSKPGIDPFMSERARNITIEKLARELFVTINKR